MPAIGPRPVLVAESRKREVLEVDDATLARAAATGDPSAHAAIWDRYSSLVRRVLTRTMGPGSDIEDHLQEVFLRFYRNRAALRDPAALRSFLFGISLRVAASELRSRRIRSWLRLSANGILDDYAAPQHVDLDAREAVARLYAILDRLETQGRLAFVLHHIEGLELVDVAQALDVSLATVKRRLARVSARLFAMAEGDRVLLPYLQARGLEKVQ